MDDHPKIAWAIIIGGIALCIFGLIMGEKEHDKRQEKIMCIIQGLKQENLEIFKKRDSTKRPNTKPSCLIINEQCICDWYTQEEINDN